MRWNITAAPRHDDPTTKHIQMWGKWVGLRKIAFPWLICLNICQQEEKSIYSNSSKPNGDSREGGGGGGLISECTAEKYFPLLSAQRLYRFIWAARLSDARRPEVGLELLVPTKAQCQKKDKRHISVYAYVTLLIFLIESIYLSSVNNLWCNTLWYANEQFKFNEFLMTKQIISQARCGVHVIWGGMNLRALFGVWVQTG